MSSIVINYWESVAKFWKKRTVLRDQGTEIMPYLRHGNCQWMRGRGKVLTKQQVIQIFQW